MKRETIDLILAKFPTRSAWERGVKATAEDLLKDYEGTLSGPAGETGLLNGARSWHDWSWGGSGLIYNRNIAERFCNPTELKRTQGGEKNPNSVEHWLDVQARAAWQAVTRIQGAAKRLELP